MFQDLDHNLSAAQFTARRLPEIKSLWRSFLQQQPEETNSDHHDYEDEGLYYQSGGKKISNRHLRRRTGSHCRKTHHRFPQGMKPTTPTMERKIQHVQRKRNGALLQTFPCRKTKRKRSTLRTVHLHWQQQNETKDEMNTTRDILPSLSESTTKTHTIMKHWLATHLWHTKRFHMSPPLLQAYGGFCIPICHNNRDSQAILRLIRENDKCTIQDATWTMGGVGIVLEEIRIPTESKEDMVPGFGQEETQQQQKQYSLSLISILQRFCGYEDPSFLTDIDFLTGNRMGYSMIYAVDSFPKGVICPGAFLITATVQRNNQTTSTDLFEPFGIQPRNSEQYLKSQVQIFVPTNVIPIVQAMIQQLCCTSISGLECQVTTDGITESIGMSEPEKPMFIKGKNEVDVTRTRHETQPRCNSYRCFIQKGCALLQIRGNSASSIMQNIFPSLPLMNRNLHNSDILIASEEAYDTNLHHGTVIRGINTRSLQLETPTSTQGSHEIVEENGSYFSPMKINMGQQGNQNEHHNSVQGDTNDFITLIWQNPNENTATSMDRSCNVGCRGWDILCSPTLASKLFYKLNTNEGACAIGLVEYATLLMEADPPLPLWPRDYADTHTGKEYWSGLYKEWNLIRYSLDAGLKGGRIHTGVRRHIKDIRESTTVNKSTPMPFTENSVVSNHLFQAAINWDRLLTQSCVVVDDDDDSNSLLLRKNSTATLNNILIMFHCHGQMSDDSKQINSCRRLRRPRKQPHHPLFFPPLSKGQKLSLRKACSTALKKMSLTALVRCCIVTESKGILMSNQTICQYQIEEPVSGCRPDNVVLGFVTAGIFSPSRGREFGMGLVSSRKLVEYLCKGEHKICALIGAQYFVRVTIIATDDDKVGVNAFISLLS